MSARKPVIFVVDENVCHVCTSHYVGTSGYPQCSSSGKKRRVYQVTYAESFGPAPDGLILRHKCDNRLCVNPEHLVLGTQLDNVRDMWERGRANPTGHIQQGQRNHNVKLTEAQVREILASTENNVQTAKRYGVTHQMIWCIRKGKSWKSLHVPVL